MTAWLTLKPVEECITDVKKWVTNICEESKTLAVHDGDRDNLHFLPQLIPHLIRLGSYLPLWTGVMGPLFKSASITASSAHFEAEFKNLKFGLFKHDNLPIRVDRVISQHLGGIEGNMRLSSAAKSANRPSSRSKYKDSKTRQHYSYLRDIRTQRRGSSYKRPPSHRFFIQLTCGSLEFVVRGVCVDGRTRSPVL
ncbi:hypothetical protein SRHO_G00118300 [Serrasalmus rhombeus]